MRDFSHYNPRAIAVYFLAAGGVSMLCMEPVILGISLMGSILLCLTLGSGRNWKIHLFSIGLFLATALINPLVSHKGRGVLFVLNHNPITLEALLYGVAAAGMIVATLYWMRCFSAVMTSDKLLYLLGGLWPRVSLVVSMALRYVPLLSRQSRRVHQAQLALGLYREDNLVDGVRGRLREFSILTTWALENGIVTADSMSARGYGTGRRSQFTLFGWRVGDVLLAAGSVLLAGLTLAGMRKITFYPEIVFSPLTAANWVSYISYGILAVLPSIIQAKEAIRWRCLKWKI